MGKKPGNHSGVAINNSAKYFNLKVDLRLQTLPAGPVDVLECFAGEGKLWDAVQKKHPFSITRTRIDINVYRDSGNIVGDSLRIINRIALSRFAIIDLDSWGSPISHVEVLLKRGYKGIVHCTYCCPIPLNPQKQMAEAYYRMDKGIVAEKPSLFARAFENMLLNYLHTRGITNIYGYLSQKHNYFYFKLI